MVGFLFYNKGFCSRQELAAGISHSNTSKELWYAVKVLKCTPNVTFEALLESQDDFQKESLEPAFSFLFF